MTTPTPRDTPLIILTTRKEGQPEKVVLCDQWEVLPPTPAQGSQTTLVLYEVGEEPEPDHRNGFHLRRLDGAWRGPAFGGEVILDLEEGDELVEEARKKAAENRVTEPSPTGVKYTDEDGEDSTYDPGPPRLSWADEVSRCPLLIVHHHADNSVRIVGIADVDGDVVVALDQTRRGRTVRLMRTGPVYIEEGCWDWANGEEVGRAIAVWRSRQLTPAIPPWELAPLQVGSAVRTNFREGSTQSPDYGVVTFVDECSDVTVRWFGKQFEARCPTDVVWPMENLAAARAWVLARQAEGGAQ